MSLGRRCAPWICLVAPLACSRPWHLADSGDAAAATDVAASPDATPARDPDLCRLTKVAAGLQHACAVNADGTLWCWGANGHGQLGDGTFADKPAPQQVLAVGSDVVQVAAGDNSTCALRRDGTLWCWGEASGELVSGQAGASDNPLPVPIAALGTAVAEVAAGGQHACARKLDGTLWCWGTGYAGDGSGFIAHATPTQVTMLGDTVAQVSVGMYDTCARTTDGTLWCWGSNEAGQLGDGSETPSALPIAVAGLGASVAHVAVGYQDVCATKTDGTLWCWGWRSRSPTPSPLASLGNDVVAAALGHGHACARKADGGLWCWGVNAEGQVGNGNTNYQESPARVLALGPASDVAIGLDFTCAVEASGSLRCWGDNQFGQLGTGIAAAQPSPRVVSVQASGIAHVAAGYHSFCALTNAGQVSCWGMQAGTQLGGTTTEYLPSPVGVALGGTVRQVASGSGGASCALVAAAEVRCWGWLSNAKGGADVRPEPVTITGLPSDTVEIAVGWGHACARTGVGELWCWGRNDNGQLGDGSDVFFSETPVRVSLPGIVAAVTTSGLHTCALSQGNVLVCWGGGDAGQLGTGTTIDSPNPMPVGALGARVRQASASASGHTCAVLTDGTVWCWGRNERGELGDGTTEWRSLPVQVVGLGGAVAVSTGVTHTCARTDDGALWCWGDGSNGQLGDGSFGQGVFATSPRRVSALGNQVAEVAAGMGADCARTQLGAVWCWGTRNDGLMADGTLGFVSVPTALPGCW